MTSSIHGTCVAIGGAGALLLGPSGSGKSDLALRLIDQGAELVADDRVELRVEAGHVVASAPGSLPPLLEVRGIGLLSLPRRSGGVPLSAVFELERSSERLPVPETWRYGGASVPRFHVDPSAPSAAARVRAVLASPPAAA